MVLCKLDNFTMLVTSEEKISRSLVKFQTHHAAFNGDFLDRKRYMFKKNTSLGCGYNQKFYGPSEMLF